MRAHALLLNLSAVLYTFAPTPPAAWPWSRRARARRVTVDATVPLASGPCNDWRGALKATPGDTERMRFTGSYALACGERVWPLAYPDPKRYASRLLAALWRDAGAGLTGSVREGPAPEGVKPSFELTSPPLADVVRDINKFSNNVMAQQLLLTLALAAPPGRAGHARGRPRGAAAMAASNAWASRSMAWSSTMARACRARRGCRPQCSAACCNRRGRAR